MFIICNSFKLNTYVRKLNVEIFINKILSIYLFYYNKNYKHINSFDMFNNNITFKKIINLKNINLLNEIQI